MTAQAQAQAQAQPPNPSPPTARTATPSIRIRICGVLASLAIGLIMGWQRYWVGFFVIAHGAVAGFLIAWLASRFAIQQSPAAPPPGRHHAFALGLLWLACFLLGEVLGFGAAQPWFDPAGWASRVLNGDAGEYVFGIAASGTVHRGFAMGSQGALWIIFNLVDLAVLLFFLTALPWSLSRKSPTSSPANSSNDRASTENASPPPPPWKNWVNIAGFAALAGWLAMMALHGDPRQEMDATPRAFEAGDYDAAIRLARRALAFGPGDPAFVEEGLTLQVQAAEAMDAKAYAARCLARLESNSPDSAFARLVRGKELLDKGDTRAGLAELDRGLAASASQSDQLPPARLIPYFLLRGETRLAQGLIDGTRQDAEIAVAASPDSPQAHDLLSRALEAQGDLPAALVEAEHAARAAHIDTFKIDLSPENQELISRLIDLQKRTSANVTPASRR